MSLLGILFGDCIGGMFEDDDNVNFVIYANGQFKQTSINYACSTNIQSGL